MPNRRARQAASDRHWFRDYADEGVGVFTTSRAGCGLAGRDVKMDAIAGAVGSLTVTQRTRDSTLRSSARAITRCGHGSASAGRTAKGRGLRLMREAGLLAPTRVGRRRGPRSHDGTITTGRPDEMWGTDATACLTTREGLATVYIAVDHYTKECIGIRAARPGTRFEGLEPLRQSQRPDGVPPGRVERHPLAGPLRGRVPKGRRGVASVS